MDSIEFGTYLATLRKSKGLTLTELGKIIGLSNPYLSQIENGKKGIPSPELLKKLVVPLGVSHVDLMLQAGYIDGTSFAIPKIATNAAKIVHRIKLDQDETIQKINDLEDFLKQKNIRFKGNKLSDQDKRRIVIILDQIFPD